MITLRTILALTILSAASTAALADSPFGGKRDFSRVVRQVKQADSRAKSAVDKFKRQVRKPVVRPRPLPQPIVKPLPKPQPVILPSPGPLPSPQPRPIDNVTLPIPRPVIDIDPIHCPTPRPRPLPIEGPVEPPQDDNADEAELPMIYEGQRVTLPVDGLSGTGRVSIKLGPIVVQAKVLSWGPNAVAFEVPTVGLAETAPASLVLAKADGTQLADIAFNFAPAKPIAPKLPQVPAGSRLTLTGDEFGQSQGNVWVKLGQIRLNATVLSWSETETIVQMPQLELENPAEAELIVAKHNGEVVERAAIKLVAAK